MDNYSYVNISADGTHELSLFQRRLNRFQDDHKDKDKEVRAGNSIGKTGLQMAILQHEIHELETAGYMDQVLEEIRPLFFDN